MTETLELWWTCNRCGHQFILREGDELIDYTDKKCEFCRQGIYKEVELYRYGKQIKVIE